MYTAFNEWCYRKPKLYQVRLSFETEKVEILLYEKKKSTERQPQRTYY